MPHCSYKTKSEKMAQKSKLDVQSSTTTYLNIDLKAIAVDVLVSKASLTANKLHLLNNTKHK